MSDRHIEVSTESVVATIELARYRTAGLFVHDCLGAALIIGSAVLYDSASGLALLTANHVVVAAQRRGRGLFLATPTVPGRTPSPLVSLHGCRVAQMELTDRAVDGATVDLCLIQLTDSQAAQVPETAQWVTRSEIVLHNEAITDALFLVFGFPVSAMTLNLRRWERRARPLCLVTERYEGDRGAWVAERTDLYLDVSYNPPRSVRTVAGAWLFAPRPPGISGCGIWTISTAGEAVTPRLVAIEHSWNRLSHALRGSLLIGLCDDLAPFNSAVVDE